MVTGRVNGGVNARSEKRSPCAEAAVLAALLAPGAGQRWSVIANRWPQRNLRRRDGAAVFAAPRTARGAAREKRGRRDVSDPGSNFGCLPLARPRWGRSRPSYPVTCEGVCGPCCCRPSATPETPAPIVPRRRAPGLATETAASSSAADGGIVMPVIKPRTRGKHLVEHRTRLDRDNHETLYAYAAF